MSDPALPIDPAELPRPRPYMRYGRATRPCRCCARRNAPLSMSGGPGPRVCVDCEMHQGDVGPKMLRRDQDHLRIWAGVVAERDHRIDKLSEEVVKREDELAARPVRIVVENLDMHQVEEATAERDRAYQSRDRAYRLLSAAALLHEEGKKGLCTCGKSFRGCEVGQLLEEEGRGLRDWELKQRQRMEDGFSHWLPAHHPLVLDQRGRAARAHERALDELPDDPL